jgi:ribosome-binding factor A
MQDQVQKEFAQAEGWLRHMVADRVQTQFSPRLEFIREKDHNPRVLEDIFEHLEQEETTKNKNMDNL